MRERELGRETETGSGSLVLAHCSFIGPNDGATVGSCLESDSRRKGHILEVTQSIYRKTEKKNCVSIEVERSGKSNKVVF